MLRGPEQALMKLEAYFQELKWREALPGSGVIRMVCMYCLKCVEGLTHM